ncbi:methyltransferase domain-containing protein [Candidatus Thorarchaeota archaeon]|nr:MAG: methyltransferase domain-containing protein [Candidatus Thorarchaeota archaeon]
MMTEYMFILGSNWLLSIAELLVYVRNRGYEAILVDHSRNAAIVDFKEKLSVEEVIDMQSALGGCYKTGRVIERYDIDIPLKAYPTNGKSNKEALSVLTSCPWLHHLWQRPQGKKIKFGVSTYPVFDGRAPIQYRRFTRGLNDTIKKLLIQKGAKKADYYAYDRPDNRDPKKMNLALWPKTIASNNLLLPPNSELLAAFTEKYLYLARSMVVYDSVLQQYRDESRPYISSEISTSPKICRTLLNLAGARPGDTVLDPFCGTGTLLMEAAMLEMKCIGVDIDADQVQGTKANLAWFARDSGQKIDFQVIRGDSRELADIIQKQVDAVAFEPSLGPVFSQQPEMDNVENTIKELTHLYHDTLVQIREILRPDGRVAMTIPVIISKTGPLNIDIRQMIKGTGLGIYRMLPSDMIRSMSSTDERLRISPEREQLPERKRGQVVQRAVVALEK